MALPYHKSLPKFLGVSENVRSTPELEGHARVACATAIPDGHDEFLAGFDECERRLVAEGNPEMSSTLMQELVAHVGAERKRYDGPPEIVPNGKIEGGQLVTDTGAPIV